MSIRAIVTFVSGRSQFEGEAAKAISRAVQKGVAIMEANIKKNTPVQTGTLRRSIHSQMTGMFSGAAFSSSTEGGKEVSYAKHVEYGTRNMAPRAMFRKGVAQSEATIQSLITGEMRNVKVNIRLKG